MYEKSFWYNRISKQSQRNLSSSSSISTPLNYQTLWSIIVSNNVTANNFFSDEPTGRLALVFELMDMNMYDAIKGKRHYLPENRVKYYMF